jgi:integrase
LAVSLAVCVRQLNPQQVQAILNRHLAGGHLARRSVAYIRIVLRAALNRARKWNLVVRNAAELVESPRLQRFEIQPLSPQQARTLLDSAKGNRLEALYAVALACGLRMGEILGLRWNSIDLERGQLAVEHALQGQKGKGLVLTETKTDRSRRTIAPPAPLIATLRAHPRTATSRTACGWLTLAGSWIRIHVGCRKWT